MSTLKILSGGAANGLVNRIAPAFTAETGLAIEGTFSAVGGLKARILAGERPDLVILTNAIIAEFEAVGITAPGAARALGRVETAIAVRAGDPVPHAATADDLRRAFTGATTIYFPDPEQATAGIHFANVLRTLGIYDATASQHRTFPNGQTAMAALAASSEARPIGCTQATEILSTNGVALVGPLPGEFALATTYTAAPIATSAQAAAARRLIALMVAEDAAQTRMACGFV